MLYSMTDKMADKWQTTPAPSGSPPAAWPRKAPARFQWPALTENWPKEGC
jgi:hypothetical protein